MEIHKLATKMSKYKNSELYTWKFDKSTGIVTKTEISTGNNWSWVPKPRPVKAVCAPKNGVTVDMLSKAGNKVRVRHLRWAAYLGHEEHVSKKYGGFFLSRMIVVPSSFGKDPLYLLRPKGGYTHITIKTDMGKYVCISSECSLEDPFCYRKGVEKALERLTDYELAELGIKLSK